MREIKYKISSKRDIDWAVLTLQEICLTGIGDISKYIVREWTGLTDKNGKEIWELCELDGRYIVIYKAPKFCLYDILKGDIIEFNDKDKHEITTEYKQLPQDAEGSID